MICSLSQILVQVYSLAGSFQSPCSSHRDIMGVDKLCSRDALFTKYVLSGLSGSVEGPEEIHACLSVFLLTVLLAGANGACFSASLAYCLPDTLA